jgi:PKD repeat protein
MKKIAILFFVLLFAGTSSWAQKVTYSNNWGKSGFNLLNSRSSSVDLVFSVSEFSMDNVLVDGQVMKNVSIPGSFLGNNEGMPNLPGQGRFIAIPQGSTPKIKIVSSRTETLHNVEVAPSQRIPLDTEKDFPLAKNMTVYSKNANYPESPVMMSEVTQIRGVDVVTVGITPFQYNPVTKDLIVYQDLKIELTFEGGSGQFGNDVYRSRWWDPIMSDNILNYSSLPVVDYDARFQTYSKGQRDTECEYIIISPDGADFQAWADTIANFRNQQGILTHVFTLSSIGGNVEASIENFINDAYNTWTIKPAACLLLGDYGTDASKNITSHMYTHPAGYDNFASDNKYADVTGDEMPDVVFSRIVANNADQLQIICSKFLDNERNPVTDSLFYKFPITALGWQTERWFQLCSEVVGGFWKNAMGKSPRRINAVYQGSQNVWSSATNTSQITSYFGPTGLQYIPSSPSELGGWTGGNSTKINQAIDSGAFILMHRDHGYYDGWGEPAYSSSNVATLNNTKLPFVFSINCQTGAYHRSADCFGERFARHTKNGHNAGALGVVCPTEVSYSFVNDAFVWGMMDNMWPDFMPAYGTTPASRGVLPAFGAAAGKYFLKQSSWPYNSGDKLVTYRLFHMLGEAFTTVYYQVPQSLTVTHDTEIEENATSFNITTNENALICLSVNNQIIATGLGTGTQQVMTIPPQVAGTMVMVTVTKQNFFRYTANVPVTTESLLPNFSADVTSLCQNGSVNFTDQSFGSPETWSWTFNGGNPATSDLQNPTGIIYSTPGSYTVSLTITKIGQDPMTITKDNYINITSFPVAKFSAQEVCYGQPVQFTDESDPMGGALTSWEWDFGDPPSATNTSNLQNPLHVYSIAGTYNVHLTVMSNGMCVDDTVMAVNVLDVPSVAAIPEGSAEICQGSQGINYVTPGATNASDYVWEILPAEAGTVTGTTETAVVDLLPEFSGIYTLKVKGVNTCGEGTFSQELPVTVKPLVLVAPEIPVGNSEMCQGTSGIPYTTTETANATSYIWVIEPVEAGIMTGTSTSATLDLSSTFNGAAIVKVKGVNDCGEGEFSAGLALNVKPGAIVPEKPAGPATVNTHDLTTSDFTTTGSSNAESYSWLIDPIDAGTISGTGLTGTVTWTLDYKGTAVVSVKGINTCGESGYSETLAVSLFTTLGIGHNGENIGVVLYPNPNNGKFTLSLNASSQEVVNITIYNAAGIEVFSENNVRISGSAVKSMDLSGLAKGIYNLKITGEKGSVTKPFVIQK